MIFKNCIKFSRKIVIYLILFVVLGRFTISSFIYLLTVIILSTTVKNIRSSLSCVPSGESQYKLVLIQQLRQIYYSA